MTCANAGCSSALARTARSCHLFIEPASLHLTGVKVLNRAGPVNSVSAFVIESQLLCCRFNSAPISKIWKLSHDFPPVSLPLETLLCSRILHLFCCIGCPPVELSKAFRYLLLFMGSRPRT